MHYLKSIILVFIFLAASASFSWATTDMISSYLYEYAYRLYQTGNIPEAIHELKKCLLVNSTHCQAKILLRKISPGIELEVGAEFALSSQGESRICPGQEVIFSAGTPSLYGNKSFIYSWDFGDATVLEAGPLASHRYSRGGRYRVRVSVDEYPPSGEPIDIKEVSICVNSPPLVDAKFNPACCVDKETIFDASDSCDPDADELRYYWDFGDGAQTQGVSVGHIYSHPGKYVVNLLVSDSSATPCAESSVSLPVEVGVNPVAIMNIKGVEK